MSRTSIQPSKSVSDFRVSHVRATFRRTGRRLRSAGFFTPAFETDGRFGRRGKGRDRVAWRADDGKEKARKTGPFGTGNCRPLVEEARHALLQLNDAQRERDDRFLISTSTAGALPHSGLVLRPKADVKR